MFSIENFDDLESVFNFNNNIALKSFIQYKELESINQDNLLEKLYENFPGICSLMKFIIKNLK